MYLDFVTSKNVVSGDVSSCVTFVLGLFVSAEAAREGSRIMVDDGILKQFRRVEAVEEFPYSHASNAS